MHGLGDRLRMSDTSLQRKVMCWKYKMLNHKFDFDDVRASLDRIRRALTNGGCLWIYKLNKSFGSNRLSDSCHLVQGL